MATDLDRRAYDILHLIDAHGPIGSIRLVELLDRHGYSIKGRTVRLALSELDEAGLTEKIPGKGRRLTPAGRAELRRGNVRGRLEQVRQRIAVLTSQVTYDPTEDAGEVIASAVTVRREDVGAALDALAAAADSPLGPVPVSLTDAGDDDRRTIRVPSSITLDGVLLARGIPADLRTAGVVEYHPDPDPSTVAHDGEVKPGDGGAILRYVDAISNEGSTIDSVSLLVEAGRTAPTACLSGDGPGLLVVDNRTFPFTRFEETRDLAVETRARLGGVLDVRKPREPGPIPGERRGREFGSLTFGGTGEFAVSLLAERGLAESWETLSGLVPRAEFDPAGSARAGDGIE